MLHWNSSQLLLCGGIALMAAAAVGAAVALAVFHLTGKRLRAKLEQEFGKKRH